MSPALEVVGRELEIDSVHDFLDAVPGGPTALLIEGEIGIGKTTLWREGAAEAGRRGLQVLLSRPVEAEIALPFAVLGDLLGEVPDAALGRLPDPQREALEVALLRAGTKSGGLQRRAVALGVLGAIRVLAEDTPLVVAIDDTQWLDSPSADALAFADREPDILQHDVGTLDQECRHRIEGITRLVNRRFNRFDGPCVHEFQCGRDDTGSDDIRHRLTAFFNGAECGQQRFYSLRFW